MSSTKRLMLLAALGAVAPAIAVRFREEEQHEKDFFQNEPINTGRRSMKIARSAAKRQRRKDVRLAKRRHDSA